MMFQHDANGVPTNICLFDFQCLRYASPVVDVVHYIFISTTKELRDKHYQEFLDIYYEALTAFIKRYF